MARVSVRIGFGVTFALLAGCGASGHRAAAVQAHAGLTGVRKQAGQKVTLHAGDWIAAGQSDQAAAMIPA